MRHELFFEERDEFVAVCDCLIKDKDAPSEVLVLPDEKQPI